MSLEIVSYGVSDIMTGSCETSMTTDSLEELEGRSLVLFKGRLKPFGEYGYSWD